MNPAKKALATTKNFVVNHRLAVAIPVVIIATAVVMKKMNESAFEVANKFIDEKGLSEEFLEYVPTDV